jgi:hypothetical protein
MNLYEAEILVKADIQANDTLFNGAVGVGKSSFLAQWANNAGAKFFHTNMGDMAIPDINFGTSVEFELLKQSLNQSNTQ